MLERRGFLRGLASIPLIGGGVTLIGRAAMAPIPLTQVAAAPMLGDPRERARYAWEAFSAAMREITADAHGWHVQGGEGVPFEYLPGHSFIRPMSLHYEYGPPTAGPRRGVIDRHREIDLQGGAA